MMRSTFSFLAFVCFALLIGCGSEPNSHSGAQSVIEFSGPTMGTRYSVKLVTNPETADIEALKSQVDARLEQLNAIFSTYISDSELMQFNAAAEDQAIAISKELFWVMSFGKKLASDSNGYFDMTIRPLVELWGFGKKARSGEMIPAEQVQAAMEMINKGDDIDLSMMKESAMKYSELSVDLSAIAKGYAVDQLVELLNDQGFDNLLVEVGGEIKAQGEKPGGQPWVIGIEKPVTEARAIEQLIKVTDMAMATSGDYRNYFEVDGQRLSHIIDPKTGYPITHNLVSATVLDENCMVADGLATAMLAMGPQKAKQLAVRYNAPVYLITKTDEGFETWYNPKMKRYLLEAAPE